MNINLATRISRNNDFLDRIEFLVVKAAVAQLAAATPAPSDVILGQRILNGGEPLRQWALAALGNATIMAGAHVEDGSSIIDSDLEFTINSLWPAFAL